MAERRRTSDARLDVLEARMDQAEEKIDCLTKTYGRYEPYLKAMADSARFWDGVKNDNIRNIVKGTIWAIYITIGVALWLLLSQSLGRS